MDKFIFSYFMLVNAITFIVYGIDKHKAKKGEWRIKESTLLLLAAIGGALGASLGMQTFRHKTKHWKFKILVPVFLIVWIVLICYLYLDTIR